MLDILNKCWSVFLPQKTSKKETKNNKDRPDVSKVGTTGDHLTHLCSP